MKYQTLHSPSTKTLRKAKIRRLLAGVLVGASLTVTGSDAVFANVNNTMAQMCDLLAASSDGNVVISPYSIRMALSMLSEGSGGKTREELEAFLEEYAKMLRLGDDVPLEIANSFWMDDEFTASDDYVTLLKERYDALAETIDFSNSTAPDIINDWVSDKTHGLIPTLVDSSISTMDAILINALYYNGLWETPFEDYDILESTFKGSSGDEDASMLTGSSDGSNYYENEQASGFRLFYEDGLEFIAILPKQEDFNLADLDLDSLLDSRRSWSTKNVSLYYELPEFKTDYSESLNDVLKQLGVSQMFSANADLSGIAPNLGVSDVIHKTAIDVNRTGTEAAAVTAIVLEAMAMPEQEPEEVIYKEVILNRPFAFLILEPDSDEILFMGKITTLQ